MLKTPRPVEDIGIHKICLLFNGEYKYFAVEKKCSFSLPQNCDAEQDILIKGFHNRRVSKSSKIAKC